MTQEIFSSVDADPENDGEKVQFDFSNLRTGEENYAETRQKILDTMKLWEKEINSLAMIIPERLKNPAIEHIKNFKQNVLNYLKDKKGMTCSEDQWNAVVFKAQNAQKQTKTEKEQHKAKLENYAFKLKEIFLNNPFPKQIIAQIPYLESFFTTLLDVSLECVECFPEEIFSLKPADKRVFFENLLKENNGLIENNVLKITEDDEYFLIFSHFPAVENETTS